MANAPDLSLRGCFAPMAISPARSGQCRGVACRARRRTCNLYKPPSKWQTPPTCHCEEQSDVAISPTRSGQCRGADSRARRNAADSNGPPLKWQRLPDLSLRGRFAPVAISGRQLRFRRGFPVIHPGTARLPRRFAPRNGNSDSLAPPNHHCNTRNCRRRSLPVKGTPHP